jgi:predicted component of type VI protein secretion system
MKRTLIIALCCLTALLAACNKEKPNEKFIGDWYGNGVANVTMTITLPAGGPINQEFNNITVPMSINLTAGETKDQVIFTYTNEEVHETYTTKGIVKNNDVDFDPISVNITVEGTTVTATLDLKGILSTSGDVLALNGAVSGQGNLADGGVPYTATGTITANLNRGTAPTPAPYNGPTITLFEDENCISEGSEVVAGELFFVALSGEGKALKDLKVVFVDNDANILEEWTKELNNGNEFTSTKYFTLTQVGDVTMTASVTDSQDKMASLDVHFKILPAPEPEFEAHYAGSVNLDATASALMLSYPINIDYDMDVMFSEAAEEGHVNATITFAGNNYNTTGTKDGDAIDLEPFDIVLDFEGSTVNATIDMSGAIEGTVFKVEGSLEGSGNISFSGASIPATIEGTVAGDLDKIE